MKVFVMGSTGATGFNLVAQLLGNGFKVRAVARSAEKFEAIDNQENLEIVVGSILELSNEKLKSLLSDVDAVVSCLGHNISIKGIFGKPHNLVEGAIKRVSNAIDDSRQVKLILMNTTGCLNKLENEQFKPIENVLMGLLSNILPPQRDNEKALAYLMDKLGVGNQRIEWVAVRPDTLINEAIVTDYTLHKSHTRSPLFNAGKTSRINVANFIMELLKSEDLWQQWKFKTPVIYNK